MKAMSGLRVDVLCTGTQGPSPSVLLLEGSARLLSLCIQISVAQTAKSPFLRLNTHQCPSKGGASLTVSF